MGSGARASTQVYESKNPMAMGYSDEDLMDIDDKPADTFVDSDPGIHAVGWHKEATNEL
jgi:hypothetical protein